MSAPHLPHVSFSRKRPNEDSGFGNNTKAERDSKLTKITDIHIETQTEITTVTAPSAPSAPSLSEEKESLGLMRQCANMYKRDLWSRFGPHARVLDMGSGKGGDLQKVLHAQVKLYIGVDQNQEFIEDARKRQREIPAWKRQKFPTAVRFLGPVLMQDHKQVERLITAHPAELTTNQNQQHQFDLVTAFWSIHSVFENETQLKAFADCVDYFLTSTRGYFVCVFMDGNEVLSWMKEEEVENKAKDNSTQNDVGQEVKSCHDPCHVIESPQKLLRIEMTKPKTFQVYMAAETVPNHEEYCVSLQDLTDVLNLRRIKLVESELLDTDRYLPRDQDKRKLLPIHKRFLACSRYCVFQRQP